MLVRLTVRTDDARSATRDDAAMRAPMAQDDVVGTVVLDDQVGDLHAQLVGVGRTAAAGAGGAVGRNVGRKGEAASGRVDVLVDGFGLRTPGCGALDSACL